MDPRINEIVPIKDEGHAAELRQEFVRAVDAQREAGAITPAERDRRVAAGPPVFREGEILELRGYRFRVGRISRRMLLLRPVRG